MTIGKSKITFALGSLVCATLLGGGAASAQDAGGVRPYPHSLVRHHRARAEPYHTLTVRRHREEPPIAVLPPPPAGPEVIVTAPVRAASDVAALPFRILGRLFPAEGDIGTNPLVLVGAPIRAAGEIAQVPFRIVEAPFAAPEPYRPVVPGIF